jgi:hypothetical protein
MSLAFVNQKTINGKTYRAYRDLTNPQRTVIECEGVSVETFTLKAIWTNEAALVALFA